MVTTMLVFKLHVGLVLPNTVMMTVIRLVSCMYCSLYSKSSLSVNYF